MPNWVEGNIRFRGACKDIKSLCENELECVGHKTKNLEIVTCKPIINCDCYALCINRPEEKETTISKAFYFKGTRRNFLDSEALEAYGEYDSEDEREVRTLVFDSFKAAWGIDAQPYLEMAKKYNVDIRIFGWEKGMEFSQEIEIVKGKIVKDAEYQYDDWDWECPMPYMGG